MWKKLFLIISTELAVNERNGGNRYKANAYRKAVQTIQAHSGPILSVIHILWNFALLSKRCAGQGCTCITRNWWQDCKKNRWNFGNRKTEQVSQFGPLVFVLWKTWLFKNEQWRISSSIWMNYQKWASDFFIWDPSGQTDFAEFGGLKPIFDN